MKFKNQKHRLFNKKAGASVGAAIKVLTSVVLGAAMLAGTYGVVKTTVVPTAENKVSSMFEVADTVELSGGGGVPIPDPVIEIKRNGVIPEGGTYTVAATSTILSAGNSFPETPATDDIYEEGDYKYTYNRSPAYGTEWSVKVKDTSKTEYGEIFSEISGKPVTSMGGTFWYNSSLIAAPKIPSSVTDMENTFYGCTSLTTAPTIPDSVTNMSSTFENCTSLTTAPTIPDSVTNMYYAFYNCTSLTTAPDMSNANSVTNMRGAFAQCKSLKTYTGSTDPDGDFSNYKLPNTVTTLMDTFSSCKSMIKAPAIPNGVTTVRSMFMNCTSLTTPPDMSNANNVTDMFETFYGCTSLTTAPTIPDGVTTMHYTFSGCTSLTTASAIPSSVTDMYYTFSKCASLTGTIEINANLDTSSKFSYSNCFFNTVKPITLTGSSSALNILKGTASNGNVTVAQ